ncbi:RNA polymerase sigma factor SigJ [Caulobacter sp. D4A]|uniref:sigma-70 family RNA polymerase sigma factor n=1 Tax=unclassified Caulobacter TaxID=2648921 RepID=UPI000D73B922|nr:MULTISPECIES: sigma-70 family RNA polymerase sigma factor [unclassified Caulobacter]PXA82552.1 RNA polymerase sigma factor SigJ [Caulobacter sp. D4A]PXA93629.1 RNA polymerase sigma factor SigJ [Caulobacter sp. D5]
MSAADTIFEDRRPAMTGLAYRMLGSRAEAEDVVQDAWLRWREVETAEIGNPAGFLNRVVSRLCLDRLKSARARRELYVGEWLPEPVVDVDETFGLGENLTVAFLLALERLTPLERAAFLLHDVFDTPFSEIAATLDRSEAAVRQLAARAREHVKAGKPRYKPSADEERRLTEAFVAAALSGDAATLRGLLAKDVVMHADGGGKVSATMNPVFGLDNAVRLLEGIARKWPHPDGTTARLARINGQPGVVMAHDGVVFQTMGLDIVDGRIAAVYTMRNPDKLARVRA